jgi:CRISPR-associated endonuclease/helicase Cas3
MPLSVAEHRSVSETAVAHIRFDTGVRVDHMLVEHLRAVADRAGKNAARFNAERWAWLAGLWHDLGKYREGFQQYIRIVADPDAHIEGRVGGREKTHSAAGALWAQEYLTGRFGSEGRVVAQVLSYLIAGHHAGLDNWFGGLKARLEGADAQREASDAQACGPPEGILRPEWVLPDLQMVPVDSRGDIKGSFALWVRMLFSALVDADFLDTEEFMDGAKAAARAGHHDMATLVTRFDIHMGKMLDKVRTRGDDAAPVNRLRADVLRQCRVKAEGEPGVYTLTVPTGGGKTLSSLAFALRHATKHGKRRVVYAIPYTSIIEQTADIFRDIFGDGNVVEHHSNVESDPMRENHRSRLACENWDAPIVVTTNVQLFESLFARRTSRCRKLHNLVDSVVVLDEAQLLPVDFLQPIIDVLRLLVRDYGVTLLLCTATQPSLTKSESFDPARGLRGFAEGEVAEIIDDVQTLYSKLRRVNVYRPTDLTAQRKWPEIATQLATHESVLTIVGRRADARELYRLLRTEHADGLWHLSALMCAQHRSDAIAAIRVALGDRREALRLGEVPKSVRVVSTQLVEAGVDLDFPVVFRAMAGLDSIAQAAGRCNREGRLTELGSVYVFVPPTRPPPGFLRQAESACRVVWSGVSKDDDAIDARLYREYFRSLYDRDLDTKRVCESLTVGRDGDIRFRDAAESFRLIDNQDAATVLVRYRTASTSDDIQALVAMIERDGPKRWLMRKLQRYGVSIYQRDIDRLLSTGDIRCVDGCPGLYVQVGDLLYDSALGVNVDGAPGDPATLVS